jgi:multisubunit Na+/H+ antiporter MnhF subunit
MVFSWRYVFKPHDAQWWVGIIFTLVGIALAFFFPLVLTGEDAQTAIWAVRILGVVFFVIGFVVLLLTLLKLPDYLVHTIGGTMGALSFGIPATIALPALLIAHQNRPNFLFAANDILGSDTWLIGGVFTALGILTTLGTIVLARYQLKNKSLGWSWSYDSDRDKKITGE